MVIGNTGRNASPRRPDRKSRGSRLRRVVAVGTAALMLTFGVQHAAQADEPPRVDLRVLVLDGGDPGTDAIRERLRGTGTPHTTVKLDDSGRPTIDEAFLGTTTGGRPHARFQGVVAPNAALTALSSAERDALRDYRSAFDVPQVNAYVYPEPALGLNWPADPGYVGVLDGTQAELTQAGLDGPFGYLKGGVPFDDLDPAVNETYGALAVPLADPPAGSSYTSLLEAPIPGSAERGSLIGEWRHDGLRDLVLTFSYNRWQQHFRLLTTGVLDWVTDGVRLGQARNYFAVHVDDAFAPNDRWDTENNCTPGGFDCPSGSGTEPETIRMTDADARHAVQWQRDNKFTMDMVYNAGFAEEWRAANGGQDALTDQLVSDRGEFRWINHTYTHPYLGCVQDVSVTPWVCAKKPDGSTKWVPRATIVQEIQQNLDWAAAKGITVDRRELVTGEHSGLRRLPVQPDDNPNLARALRDTGVKWIASDNSREPEQRKVGPARTVPRHPMSLYYNVGTAEELVDEYNWIYTSEADGGSGVCETDPNSTCLPEPLDVETGFEEYIKPLEVRIALSHATDNDPRPHYIHQSNLAEERLAYPVLTSLLDTYRGLYAKNTPLLNRSQRQLGVETQRRGRWAKALADGHVTGYRIGDTVTLQVDAAAGALPVPATAPKGTTVTGHAAGGTRPLGGAYAGSRSGWTKPAQAGGALTLQLPN
ncbi:hypothetical protein [Streptomyces alkaliterrae]|nr:hypothetical protein [Streptomyces alkaliterrae]